MPVLTLCGVLLVALTMRAPILAVAPTIADLRASLRIGPATAGLLTTVPVLCFGLGTPLVLAIVRRAGVDRAILVGLVVTLAGTLLRSGGTLAFALLGTLVLGLGITVGNVVVPVIIGRDFAGRTTAVTAAYSSSLNVGSMLATTLTAPLAGWLGWQVALASWGLVAVVAAAVWQVATSRSPTSHVNSRDDDSQDDDRAGSDPAGDAPSPVVPRLWRRPLVVGMTVAFAVQSFSYYGVSAWLPALLRDDLALSVKAAGASASIFQILALVGAFAIPAMVSRGWAGRTVLGVVCTWWIILPLGLALAPRVWPLWCAFGGMAQGGGFTVIFSAIALRAGNQAETRRVSAAVQGVGYCLGATGPIVVGSVHALTGGWSAPMLLVAGGIVVMFTAGSLALTSRA